MMKRLFEFGDLDCIPKWYHFYLRSYLVLFYRLFGYYKLWIPSLTDFIRQTQANTLLEYCSGSGEVMKLIAAELKDDEFKHVDFILSDLKPQPEFVEIINKHPESNGRFRYITDPVDATAILEGMDYPRIFVNSFHHFTPAQVEKIMKYNLERGNEVIILEYVRNTPLGYISMLTGALSIFLTLPFVIKLKDLPLMAFFTYVLPIFPLMVLWDGVVSCMHVYNQKQLTDIVKKIDIPAHTTGMIKRSLFYPAGVTIFTVTFDRDKPSLDQPMPLKSA